MPILHRNWEGEVGGGLHATVDARVGGAGMLRCRAEEEQRGRISERSARGAHVAARGVASVCAWVLMVLTLGVPLPTAVAPPRVALLRSPHTVA